MRLICHMKTIVHICGTSDIPFSLRKHNDCLKEKALFLPSVLLLPLGLIAFFGFNYSIQPIRIYLFEYRF